MTDSDPKYLEALKSVQELNALYKDSPRPEAFTALILGESGSGKSFLIRTARKPVHVDIFDPGGTINLDDLIRKGEIVADIRWMGEDPRNPHVFKEWEKVSKERLRSGYFNYFGTYVLDSSTTWANTIMNQQMKEAGLAGEAPRFTHDYVPQKVKIQNWINTFMTLPCDFFLTGHLEGLKDDVTGRMSYRYMVTGKAQVTIPLLFDEIYVMDPKSTASGVEYRILTQSTGTHLARSRMAKKGLLKTYEEPDLKKILAKCGRSTADKPLFTTTI